MPTVPPIEASKDIRVKSKLLDQARNVARMRTKVPTSALSIDRLDKPAPRQTAEALRLLAQMRAAGTSLQQTNGRNLRSMDQAVHFLSQGAPKARKCDISSTPGFSPVSNGDTKRGTVETGS